LHHVTRRPVRGPIESIRSDAGFAQILLIILVVLAIIALTIWVVQQLT
jgi:flagellar biogenesis protein FliO